MVAIVGVGRRPKQSSTPRRCIVWPCWTADPSVPLAQNAALLPLFARSRAAKKVQNARCALDLDNTTLTAIPPDPVFR
jgi:hypothetical protein